MNIRHDGINFLKYVLDTLGKLGYPEPKSAEIRTYNTFMFDIKCKWEATYGYCNEFVMVVRKDGCGYIFIEDAYGKCKNAEIYSFKTSDINIQL